MEALNLTNQGPTTKDLYIDDTLTHKEKFLRYHRSLIQLQRLGQIKLIPIVVESIGYDFLNFFFFSTFHFSLFSVIFTNIFSLKIDLKKLSLILSLY